MEEVAGLTKEEQKKKAAEISQSRILTQEEFKQIRMRQMAKDLGADKKTGRKRKSSEVNVEEEPGE